MLQEISSIIAQNRYVQLKIEHLIDDMKCKYKLEIQILQDDEKD